MLQLETSSRIVLDYFATKINDKTNTVLRCILIEFANFGLILKIYLATVARQSQDIRESGSQLSRECGLFSFSLLRQSRDSLAKYFDENICINFLNLFKNFATSSRLVRDT